MSPTDPRIDAYLDLYVDEHPSSETLHDYRDATLAKDEHSIIAEHLTHCEACCSQLRAIEKEISTIAADTGLRDRLWPRISDGIHEAKSHADSTCGTTAITQLQSRAKTVTHAEGSLPIPVLVTELPAVLDRNTKPNRVDAANSPHLALAAAEDTLPELRPINDLLPGFTGDATGDGCAPSQSSVLRLACTAPESPRPRAVPLSIIAVWPAGQTTPIPVLYRAGRWRFDVPLPLPWPETHALLESDSIRIVTL